MRREEREKEKMKINLLLTNCLQYFLPTDFNSFYVRRKNTQKEVPQVSKGIANKLMEMMKMTFAKPKEGKILKED